MKVEKGIAYPYIRKEENKSIFIQVNFVMQTDGQSWQRDFIWKVDEPLNKEEENNGSSRTTYMRIGGGDRQALAKKARPIV